MTDKKLTDEEIIKRLERCVKRGNRNYDTDIVLDLINRQKEEIDDLNKQMEWLTGYNGNLINANTALSEEILLAKAEAYKEFAERIKIAIKVNVVKNLCNDIKGIKGVYNTECVLDDIDNLLKEMVGEDE